MDPNRNNPRDVTPHRPSIGMPAQRPMQRPVFSDFTTRPVRPHAPRPVPPVPAPQPTTTPTPPGVPAPQPVARPAVIPVRSGTPTTTHAPQHQPAPHHQVQAHQQVASPTTQSISQPQSAATAPQMDGFLRPAAPAPAPSQPMQQHVLAPQPGTQAAEPATGHLFPAATLAPQPAAPALAASSDTAATAEHHAPSKTKAAKAPRSRSENAHAGLVGLVLFILLTALFVLPLLPGKVLDNFPGSSASFSTGDQAIGCVTQLENQRTNTSYDSKVGFPITYRYATSTHQTATCGGQTQSAVTGHTSQFNPLGLLINITSALALAVIVGKVWGKVFGRRD